MSKMVLIVEDDQKIALLINDYLKQADYEVSWVSSGEAVIDSVKSNPPDLVLLDLMLPGKDGLAICREIRSFSNVPIIMVTAKVEEIDRLKGLELGADDYICKPFSPREVVARVKAVLRRTVYVPTPTGESSAQVLILDENARSVVANSHELHLTPSEFDLLKVMIASPKQVFSRAELFKEIQGFEFEGYERTIDSHIKNLRKKISEKLPNKDIIRTVYGVGYAYYPPE
jgi:two-component system response regulator BaeR